MAISSISSVINAGFITRFEGLAQQSSASTKGTKASSNAVTVADGLRFGARTLGSAVQSLNSVIGVVNLANDKLKKILKVTDDLIDVATKAYQPGIGPETRARLNSKFEDLGEEFRKIISKGKVGDFEVLTEEGLAKLFKQIGLDKDKSASVASIFKQLHLVQDDPSLASEEAKAKRPLEIPASVYVLKASGTEFNVAKVTSSAGGSGPVVASGISSVNSVSVVDVGGVATSAVVSSGGAVTVAAGVTQSQTLLAVNEKTGEYLVQSVQDLTGDNPAQYAQIFLYSSAGQVQRQVTTNSGESPSFVAADLSADSKTVAYYDGNQIIVNRVSNNSDYPPTVAATPVFGPNVGALLKISNSGDYLAVSREDGTNGEIYNVAADSEDGSFSGTNVGAGFGFASDGVLLYQSSAGDLITKTFGGSSVTIASGGLPLKAVIEQDSTTPGPAFYVTKTSVRDLSLIQITSVDGTLVRNISVTGSLDQISFARNSGNGSKIETGISGVFPALSDDPTPQLYRSTYNPLSAPGRRVSSSASAPADILDSTILSRPDAYRVLKDLQALKAQIKDNLEAFDGLRELLGDNISLLRNTGLAFLDASSTIASSESAAQVATKLQQKIKQNSGLALAAQAENLLPVTVATLAYESTTAKK